MTEAETAKPPADVHGLAAMVAWFLAGARTQPVALAVEDLHWADPTSLDLLRSLVERGGQAPLMILATARPEFRAPWAMRSNHSPPSTTAPTTRSRRSSESAIPAADLPSL